MKRVQNVYKRRVLQNEEKFTFPASIISHEFNITIFVDIPSLLVKKGTNEAKLEPLK